MASSGPGLIRQLWYRWKALKLPWRRQYLVGADLAGNTFWEFKDALNSNRFRRIVKYGRAAHYADVKISPQWHSWLRHTRYEAPSIQEQQYEISRQASMKQLAERADERWKSVPSFLDAPNRQQPAPAIGVKDPGGYAPQTESEDKQGVISGVEDQGKVNEIVKEGKETKDVDEGRFKGKTRQREPAPWEGQRRGAPGEDWQPQSWMPGAAQRR